MHRGKPRLPCVLGVLLTVSMSAASSTPAVELPAPPCRHQIGSRSDDLSLWALAKLFFCDGRGCTEIYAANRDLLENPHVLPRGLSLRIPASRAGEPHRDGASRPDRGTEKTDTKEKGAIVTIDSTTIRKLATAAVRSKHPQADLERMAPGHIVCMQAPRDPEAIIIVASWLGREPTNLVKGTTPGNDLKQVEKIEVRMHPDGRVLGVRKTHTWLSRRAGEREDTAGEGNERGN